MTQILLTGARIIDGTSADCEHGMSVLVADGRIQEISSAAVRAPDARILDLAGRTLMPGMIDAHVHAFASDVVVQNAEAMGEAYRTAHAIRMLRCVLRAGTIVKKELP